MHTKKLKPCIAKFLYLFIFSPFCFSQSNIKDKRGSEECLDIVNSYNNLPKEVKFGISIEDNRFVNLSISNFEFFNSILKNETDGIILDIVSKKLYDCSKESWNINGPHDGEWTRIMFKKEILEKGKIFEVGHNLRLDFGTLKQKYTESDELEGNILILKNGNVCLYEQIVNIPMSTWELLPMGFYLDSEKEINTQLLNDPKIEGGKSENYIAKEIKFEIPFQKNKYEFDNKDIKLLYDSLNLNKYTIKSIEIRAYTSIEGSAELNAQLQLKRAKSLTTAIQKYQKNIIDINIQSAENWMEFYEDIKDTDFDTLSAYSELEIKKMLTNKYLLDKIEPVLKNHRKGIVTLIIEKKTGYESLTNELLLSEFKKNIGKKQATTAYLIQKELLGRISDYNAPEKYLNKLEVPHEYPFWDIVNFNLIFQYQKNQKNDKETISEYEKIVLKDPNNPKLNYNLVALKLQNSDYEEIDYDEIKNLKKLGIDISLIRRMIINYHIRRVNYENKNQNWPAKDESIDFISKKYTEVFKTDQDLLIFAKFLTYYSHLEVARILVKNRIDKIDVDEDLLFFYVNSVFFKDEISQSDFEGAIRNSIVINKNRFCSFFDSINTGGASFQLLKNKKLKKHYCEFCETK